MIRIYADPVRIPGNRTLLAGSTREQPTTEEFYGITVGNLGGSTGFRRILERLGRAAHSPEPASAYPAHPVRLLMGPAAGGPTDAVGRVLATRLSEMWKQPVIVENRPGAGNTIATAAAARATADGHWSSCG